MVEIIVCLDDENGMAFNHRRQSSDRALINDVCMLAEGRQLWMNAYSAPLFAEAACVADCHVSAQFLAEAPAHALCFVEDQPLAPHAAHITRFVVYHWNRRYPADVRFDLSLDEWQLVEIKDFRGHSHERITREVYVR